MSSVNAVSLLRELPCCHESFQLRAPAGVLSDRRSCFGIPRAALGIDDFDIRRGTFAECHVGDAHDLFGLGSRGSRVFKSALSGGDRFASRTNLGGSLPLEVQSFGSCDIHKGLALPGLAAPLS